MRKKHYAGKAFRMAAKSLWQRKVPWAITIAGYGQELVPQRQLLQQHGNLPEHPGESLVWEWEA